MAVPHDEKALHAMAKKIGLKREWFQTGGWPHYDLTPSMWVKAIKCGAKPITAKGLARLRIAERRKGFRH